MWLSSFGFAWVQSGAPRGRRVHSSSRGFNPARQCVVGFRVVSLRRNTGSFGFIRDHVGARCRTISFGFAWVHFGEPRVRRVHSCSRGFTLAYLVVVWFITVLVGSLGRVMGSWGSFGVACVHLGALRGRRVHSG